MNQTKNYIKASFGGGVFFGTVMGLYTGILSGSLMCGIGIGVFMGISFGLALGILVFFLNRGFKKKNMIAFGNEKIIFDGPANHFKGKESVGGHLYLTKKELIFISHKLNIQVHESIIPINQICDIKTVFSLGLIPNGLHIVTNNSVEKFVVFDRKCWVHKINDLILSNITKGK